MEQEKIEAICPQEKPIHERFGLSYANYLVLPRSALQSMSVEWQKKVVELLNEMDDVIDEAFEPDGGYLVKAKDTNGKFANDPYSDYERGRRRLRINEPRKVPSRDDQVIELIQEAKRQITIEKKPMIAVEALHTATDILAEKESNHVAKELREAVG